MVHQNEMIVILIGSNLNVKKVIRLTKPYFLTSYVIPTYRSHLKRKLNIGLRIPGLIVNGQRAVQSHRCHYEKCDYRNHDDADHLSKISELVVFFIFWIEQIGL